METPVKISEIIQNLKNVKSHNIQGFTSSILSAFYHGKPVIVKLVGLKNRKYGLREAHVLNKIKHENIIHLIEWTSSKCTVCLVLDMIYGCDLLEFLSNLPRVKSTIVYYRGDIMCQTVAAIKYLHQNNITHNDIKMDNVVYNPYTRRLKLIDFGYSKQHLTRPCVSFSTKGTLKYIAPEILKDKGYDPYKTDIYSLTFILFFCIKTKLPNESSVKVKHYPLKHIIMKMFSRDPRQRPDIEEIESVLHQSIYYYEYLKNPIKIEKLNQL